VLFLFFLLGWMVHRVLFNPDVLFKDTVLRPLSLFALIVAVSGLVSFLKFANFFPFLSDSIYELKTNVNGVSAGGAIMSTLFHTLNYLSGIAFFFIVATTIKSKGLIHKILLTLTASIFLSLFLGFFQAFKDPSLGNTAFWIQMGQINATFKDPNALGAVLAMVSPVVLSLIVAFKGSRRIFGLLVLAMICALFPHIGSRSAFLGFVAALLSFFIFLVFFSTKFKEKHRKRTVLFGIGAGILIVFLIVGTGIIGLTKARLFERIRDYARISRAQGIFLGVSPERFFLWKEALAMTKDYPLSGVGMGSYIIELPNYYTYDQGSYQPDMESFRRNDSAENYFLHISAETGIPGLIVILTIFWLVFRKVRSSFRESQDTTDKILLVGLSAGLVSYAINLFFHTYIGSFDTKYTFWLLTAVIFSLGTPEKGQKEKRRQKRGVINLSTALLLLFTASYLWNSTHSLSLKRRMETFQLVQNFGFYQQEKDESGRPFRWTKGAAGMTIHIEDQIMDIPLLASHPDIQENPVAVKVFVVKDFFRQKKLLDTVILKENAWRDFTFRTAEDTDENVILLFKVSRTWNPQKILGVPDPRRLGVAVGKIRFREK
jgi:O-antigen ligase